MHDPVMSLGPLNGRSRGAASAGELQSGQVGVVAVVEEAARVLDPERVDHCIVPFRRF